MREGAQLGRYINPILRVLKKLGGSGRPVEIYDLVAEEVGLSEEERAEEKPSGGSRFENQVAWARFYLARAGFIDSSRRGVWSLTDKGLNRPELSSRELDDLIRQVQDAAHGTQPVIPFSATTTNMEAPPPEEGPRPETLSSDHRARLMDVLISLPPSGFERLCQRLLRESGFERVTVTGRSGDGGIDGVGIVAVNPFVSFKVLFQCKRYSGALGAPQVRDFRGAMMGRADKGIIMTTGVVTGDALKEASRDGVPPIEVIDGGKLLDLFEEFELGLVPRRAYDLDERFFEEFKK